LQDSKLKGALKANDCEAMHQFDLKGAHVDGAAEMKGIKVGTALILENAKFGSSVDPQVANRSHVISWICRFGRDISWFDGCHFLLRRSNLR
jgi:hypothetical protein